MRKATLYKMTASEIDVDGSGIYQFTERNHKYEASLMRPFDRPPQAQAMFVRHAVEVKRIVDHGQERLICLGPGIEELSDLLSAVEYNRIYVEADDRVRAAETKFQNLRNDLNAFEHLPWWKRMWCAYRKILP